MTLRFWIITIIIAVLWKNVKSDNANLRPLMYRLALRQLCIKVKELVRKIVHAENYDSDFTDSEVMRLYQQHCAYNFSNYV